ncbi:MAG: nuclear transport factor 2 family protein [Dehalococcoidia bacterium]|nr:nuclear transport factor 2 family protein [Dehalococcoidia bacterium]MCB9486675.1 nuclear transport factor 2 family protein [Thermoflexaceae bacterium]
MGRSPKEIVLGMMASFDASGRYLASYADDAVWDFAPTAENPTWARIEGKAARQQVHHMTYDRATFLEMTVNTAVAEGPFVAVAYTFRTRGIGQLPGLEAGAPLRIEVVTIYEVRDGLIVAQKQYSGPSLPDADTTTACDGQ